MHVIRLEVQGFKTFAKKTTLQFLPPTTEGHGITSIVGPNGSGKSNIADAIRWVLGEQSMKLLRGKKSEDIIFSGSKGRSRSGFAEVAITLDNQDYSMPVDASEVMITRRLFRDGQSEYLVNNRNVRLADIHLLLAEANVGQQSYCVIGQGMVDHILLSTPEERKAFFDDATGVKPLQLKRHQALLKLRKTYENLSEAHLLLAEISPRLRSLKRQVLRLEKRESLEKELHELEQEYYGTLWWKIQDQMKEAKAQFKKKDVALSIKIEKLETVEKQLQSIEEQEQGETRQDEGLMHLQVTYRQLQKEQHQLREEQYEIRRKIELEKVKAQSQWTPLPLSKIIQEIDGIAKQQEALLLKVKATKTLDVLDQLQDEIEQLVKKSRTLADRLQRPVEDECKTDPLLEKKLNEKETAQTVLSEKIQNIEKQMDSSVSQEQTVRKELIDLQKILRTEQKELHFLETERNSSKIELARLEERQTNLTREMQEAMKTRASTIFTTRPDNFSQTESLYAEIQRMRYKLELIGGIDPEIMQEYEEIRVRYDFLEEQMRDLEKALEGTEQVIDELDKEVKERSETAFKEINKAFQNYFKILFGGGTCSLVKMTKQEVEEETEVTLDRAQSDTGEEVRREQDEEITEMVSPKRRERKDHVVGIDIQATPPAKRLKALNLLSGGERALTSIALLSAIMSVNPSPFVVLDEVDAALDEGNTFRFASIIEKLQTFTQFIVITHNRATMSKSDVLYGVTMGEDGVSNLLSVNLQEAGKEQVIV